MTELIIIAVVDVSVLLGFGLLGGMHRAAEAFKDWGCAAGQTGRAQACRS
jgi:hypothetical protein